MSIVQSMSEDRAIAPDPAVPDPAGLREARAQHRAVIGWVRGLSPVLILIMVAAASSAHPGPSVTGRGLVVSLGTAGVAAGFAGQRLGHHAARVPDDGRGLRRPPARRLRRPDVGAADRPGCGDRPGRRPVRRAQAAGPGRDPGFRGRARGARRDRGDHRPRPRAGRRAAGGRWPDCIATISLAERLGQANDQAERLLAELQASRAAEARAAGLAERQRLAREIHDVLAHSLSGLLLKLEGARMLAARDPGDPRLPETIDDAHHLARSGLDEARRAIGALRGEQMPGPDRLPALVERFRQDRGIPCRLTVSGAEHRLGADARLRCTGWRKRR